MLAAATDKSSQLFAETLPWLLVLLAVIVVGGAIMYFARRAAHTKPDQSAVGFTLNDLRDLHQRGELSDDEFERAKVLMIGRIKTSGRAKDSGSASPSAHNSRGEIE